MSKKVIIGTRGSQLALWQARYLQQLLSEQNVLSDLKIIVTSGDRNQSWQESFDKLEGKNFFTKEIEEALLKKEIDIAVHSFKDVEATFYDDTSNTLIIAGLSDRHPPNDILIIHPEYVDKSKKLFIKDKARIGTSSARRYAQLHSLRPDIQILPLRGNVPTRIEKLNNRLYDGIIIARAGVERLNIDLNHLFVLPLPLHEFVPAAGQGIIAFQIHKDNTELFHLLQKITCKDSEECSRIERTILKKIGGGCSKPVGILCEKQQNKYRVYTSYSVHKDELSIISITDQGDFKEAINQAESSIQNIQNLLQTPEIKNVFISKKLEEESYFKRLMKRLNWNIIDEPFIETRPLSINPIPDCDWVFFNSKNAVKYFLEAAKQQKLDLNTNHLACISTVTAAFLEKYGFTPHFVGQGNDVTKIGEQFSLVCKNQRVLFPCSSISLGSIEKLIEPVAQVIHFPVYENIEKPKAISLSFDYLIFTSPSNVRSYLRFNTITAFAKIIALGESTKQELLKYNIPSNRIIIPDAFDESAVLGAIFSHL